MSRCFPSTHLRGAGLLIGLALLLGCGRSQTPVRSVPAQPGGAPSGPSSGGASPPPISANELGRVMILEYHKIGEPEERWQRTPANFRKDLQRLYDQGYRLLSLRDLVTNHITTPAGFTPVVLTFDDSSPGQFRYLEQNGRQVIDPNCAVGILQAFAQAHPDFGLEATFFLLWNAAFGSPQQIEAKVKHLVELGMDIGNHTWSHDSLRTLSEAGVRQEIGRSVKRAREILPDYPLDLLCLPYGAAPKNDALLAQGTFEGISYTNRAALLVGAEPTPVPPDKAYRSLRVPRIQAIDSELDKWFQYFQDHPEERFISDGDPDVITFPESERDRLEESRLGGRRVNVYPLPEKKSERANRPVWVKGIYVTGWVAGLKSRFGQLIQLVDDTELNAVVIDVKDTDGAVSYESQAPLVRQLKTSEKRMADVGAVLDRLQKHGIYPIARITVFKDDVLPKRKPEWAVKRADGSLWRDRKGHTWCDPYNRQVWDYAIEIAIDAAQQGFREVQFDYVRFPSDGNTDVCVYPAKDDRPAAKVIGDFLAYARQRLEPHHVFLAADLFGLTGLAKDDMGIGQVVAEVAPHLDYLCPMVYPSHYALGEYGIARPNHAPFEIVYLSLRDSYERILGTRCHLRPWLQAFSLYGVHYGPAELRAQIDAAHAAGFSQWLLWNPQCRYDDVKAALRRESRTPKTAEDKTAEGEA